MESDIVDLVLVLVAVEEAGETNDLMTVIWEIVLKLNKVMIDIIANNIKPVNFLFWFIKTEKKEEK